MFKHHGLRVVLALTFLVGSLGSGHSSAAAASRTFPETGKTVSGRFLDYWEQNGGLAQQGYPISDEIQEQSDVEGKTYTMQYFERAVFEMHPENPAPYDVLLSLLGTTAYNEKYKGNAQGQKASTTNPRTFTETGKTIGGAFRRYWETHGGLAQQGYPISDEFEEKSAADGNTYTVQYFERAVFELHPENAGKPSEVLLSLLGRFRLDSKGASGGNNGGGPVVVSPTLPPQSTSSLTIPGWTHVLVTTNNIAFFYNSASGRAATARVGIDGSITQLQTRPRADAADGFFRSGFTQVVAGPGSLVLFYMKATGDAELYKMGDDGKLVDREALDFTPGWDLISLDMQTGIRLSFNRDAETMGVARLDADRTNTNLQLITNTSRYWSSFTPVGSGIWLWYLGIQDGAYMYNIDPTGKIALFNTIVPFSNESAWRNIASNGVHMLFYDQANGQAMTAIVGQDGSFASLKSYSGLSNEWTHIMGAPNGVFLIYSNTTGRISTDQVDPAGNETALKRYEPGQ